MLIIGLTGNIAAGKSTVARLFAKWGATVIDADTIVRELQQPGQPVHAAIVAHFGGGIVAPDGSLDRAALRARILANPNERLALNAIVHPAVHVRRAELTEQARAQGTRIVVHDIPLLFEVMDPAAFDGIVLVDAPVALRRERLMARRGLSAAEAEAMIGAQMPSEVKRGRSTWVIDNGGSEGELVARTEAVWGQVLRLTDAPFGHLGDTP